MSRISVRNGDCWQTVPERKTEHFRPSFLWEKKWIYKVQCAACKWVSLKRHRQKLCALWQQYFISFNPFTPYAVRSDNEQQQPTAAILQYFKPNWCSFLSTVCVGFINSSWLRERRRNNCKSSLHYIAQLIMRVRLLCIIATCNWSNELHSQWAVLRQIETQPWNFPDCFFSVAE